jgi:hypothetical protein
MTHHTPVPFVNKQRFTKCAVCLCCLLGVDIDAEYAELKGEVDALVNEGNAIT